MRCVRWQKRWQDLEDLRHPYRGDREVQGAGEVDVLLQRLVVHDSAELLRATDGAAWRLYCSRTRFAKQRPVHTHMMTRVV